MSNNKNTELWKYAGLSMQFFASIGIAVWIGIKIDQWLDLAKPLCAWVFPLLVIIGIIISIFRATGTKKK